MTVHELKIAPEYFNAIQEGIKKFEIRKNDRNYQKGDFLILSEFKEGDYTGFQTIQMVTYLTDYEQKEGYVVLSIDDVPSSFPMYLSLSDKEKQVFRLIVSHMHLYGYIDRDYTNTVWDIIKTLLENHDLSETEQQWYMEYWEGIH